MKKGFQIQNYELDHLRYTEKYTQLIDRLYNQAILEFARMSLRVSIDPEKPFSFQNYPITKATAANIINGLASKMKAAIETGSREQWLFANVKNDAFLESILETSKVDKAILAGFQDRNLDALKAFQTRKVNGVNLSERVWDYTKQFQSSMELGIDVGIGEGKSAQLLSRDLRDMLINPDKLFRRVRDKRGQLQLSKAAKLFEPGQGVYRSSYKNAMRLTRSEVNMAYRTADGLRWKKMDFVIGYEIKLSNNHTINGKPLVDICDDLAGKYPKDFEFLGWHPQCRCFKVPLLQNPKEFDTNELNELKAALNGTEYESYVPIDTVSGAPKNFTDWIEKNQARIDGYKSTPYFIRDNFTNGKIAEGLKF